VNRQSTHHLSIRGRSWIVFAAVGCLASIAATVTAAEKAPAPVTRLVFQDDESRTVKWADVTLSGSTFAVTSPKPVPGFPQLDATRQGLVQMESSNGFVIVGIRDNANGEFGSGWVLINSGVEVEDHGDHSHCHYVKEPKVIGSQIDAKQGNPAHVYCYDKVFYLANDKLNGYTRLDPRGLAADAAEDAVRRAAVFHPGGGGHITMAASGLLGYSSWIDREGANKGRVDITPLANAGTPQIRLSVTLPSGGIHGAIAAGGKVFFAPTDGICWFNTFTVPPKDAAAVTIHHISLGEESGKPVRTGAFTALGNTVLFTTGAGANAAVWTLNAADAAPTAVKLPLPMAEGNRPAGLEAMRTSAGIPLAFVFHNHAQNVEAPNLLSILELDPNNDGNYADARVAQNLEVGKCKVEGHGGHHSVSFDADGSLAVFSNPGSGTISVLSLSERKVVHTETVGGVPTKVIAIGGAESDH
jgi:hypothetical protein